MQNRKQKMISVVIGVAVVIIAVAAFLIEESIRRHTPSKEHMGEGDVAEMFGMEDENLAVVLNHRITDGKGYPLENGIYLEYHFVKENLNSRFYWDNNENILIYTTPTEIIKANVGEKQYYVNKTKNATDYPVVKTDGANVYINILYVKQYSNMEYEQLEEPGRICITSNYGEEIPVVTALKESQVRMGASIKDKIVADVSEGDELVVLPGDEEQKEDWLKVTLSGGFYGYIKKSAVGEEKKKVLESSYEEPVYTSITRDGTVCMGWHMVTNAEANNTLLDVTEHAKGLNVISPTWFRIIDNEGNLSSLADKAYVQRAHQIGLEVWAMVDDQSADSKDGEVFPYTSKRENIQNQLLAAAIEYGLDGINVDFEYIQEEFAEDYVQFLREFSVKCRNNGIVFSIDNYVPMPYNRFYNRKEQGIVADYVVIMGYDEHNKSSEEAGSVASLKWVREGIENTLKEVPSKKVINAVPFYTRIWEEQDGVLSSRALGMQDAWSEMEGNHASTIWVEEFGQTYAEYKKDGTIYRCWLENSASIEEKAKLIGECKLAGIACWRLGYETSDVWNTIIKYTN